MAKKNKRLYSPDKLIAARAVKGIRVDDLAKKAGMAELTLRQVLRGESKSLDKIIAASAALNLKVSVNIEEAI